MESHRKHFLSLRSPGLIPADGDCPGYKEVGVGVKYRGPRPVQALLAVSNVFSGEDTHEQQLLLGYHMSGSK